MYPYQRGDTQALGTLDVPNTVCLVRTRKDSRGGALPPQRGRFFLARLAWRAGRPRYQRRACWERERLDRMAAKMPCSATPRAGTPAKKPTPLRGGGEGGISKNQRTGTYQMHSQSSQFPPP